MIGIEVCERLNDWWEDYSSGKCIIRPKFHAQIKDKPGFWGCGGSPNEAISSLIISHPEMFSIEITNIGKQPR